ncbi:MAG TPA: ABC transporter substrate-binding protein [Tardiphaga sp.]
MQKAATDQMLVPVRTERGFSQLGERVAFISRILGRVVVALALCASQAVRAGDDTLIAVMNTSLRVLDPIVTSSYVTRDHAYMIYDVLVALDDAYQVRPQMADWTVSDDGLAYVFTLREGLLFHDGQKVKADDAIASLRRWGTRDNGGQLLFEQTAALEAPDDRTIVWRLKRPFPALLQILGKPSSLPPFIMPRRIADTPADRPISDSIGSGPFKFVASEFRPGVSATYEKFDGYVPRPERASWMAGGKIVNVRRVQWITMPDAQTAVNALVAGEIDYIEGVPVDLLPVLKLHRQVVAEVRSALGHQVIGRMNFRHPPFDNADLRRAAMLALNQKDILTAMVGSPDYFRICGAIFGCGTPLADATGSDSLTGAGDVEGARALLKKAAYDGTRVLILEPVDVPILAAPPRVAAQALRQAGFNVELQSMDWQTSLTRRANMSKPADGGWSMFFTVLGIPEISSPLSNVLLDGRGDKAWFGWPDDARLETLRQDFLSAGSADAQKSIAKRIQAHALDEVTYVPLGEYQQVQARSDRITGMIPSPNPVFWGVAKAP